MLLNPKYSFGREFGTLKAAVGSDDDETKALLSRLGARHKIAPSDRDTWTLHSEGNQKKKL